MKLTLKLHLTVASLLIFSGYAIANVYFQIEMENKAINPDVTSIENQTTESQTSCLLNCMRHAQCCYVELKNLVSKWSCAFFSFEIDLTKSNKDDESDVFSFTNKERCYYKDCLTWYQMGYKFDGVYDILVNGNVTKVYCDMTQEGGGWTTFQRRLDGSVNFQRRWEDYKKGFGDVNGEYWIGNEFLHQVSSIRGSETLIRIKGTNFAGETKFIIFQGFKVESEDTKYRLHTGVFKDGDKGVSGSWVVCDGNYFTSSDMDNDSFVDNCSIRYGGGWWFGACFAMNPNNHYSKVENVTYGKGISWVAWLGNHRKSMKHISMSFK